MPVRSLTSSVLVWPNAETVAAAVRQWAADLARAHPETLRIGYHGSYARGDWGVGSDVDLVIIVQDSDEPFERRAIGWDTAILPVPADIAVYTHAEWETLVKNRPSIRKIAEETVWVFVRET